MWASLVILLIQSASAQLLPPTVGAYHGAYADFGPMANDVSVEKIQDFERLAGKRIVWAYFANDWLDGNIAFPQKNVEECKKAQVIPYIRLMPWVAAKAQATKSDPIFSMDAFLNGNHDPALQLYALAAKNAGTQLILEFGPEVNGDWFPWNGRWNGAGKTKGYGDPAWPDGPEKFRDVYRHIINIFRQAGVKNVTWVFHVDTAWIPRASWNEAKNYYPGDDYIDWIGLSVFGAQLPTHRWSLFLPKLQSFNEDLDLISKIKPVMISEFAAIENRRTTSYKESWIKQALQSIELGLAPRIKGVSYWHSIGWYADGSASFRIDSSVEAQRSYQDMIQSSFWLTKGLFNE